MLRLYLHVTALADADVTLPVAVAVALVLLAFRRSTLAIGWSVAVGATLGAVLVLKLLFGIFIVLGSWMDVTSPSGHVASATIVWGGVALLLIGRTAVALAAGALIAAVIAVTRLKLGAHSIDEVVIGGAAGLLGLAALGRRAARTTSLAPGARAALLAASVVTTAAFYGGRAPIEGRLNRIELHAARALHLPISAAEQRYISLYGAG